MKSDVLQYHAPSILHHFHMMDPTENITPIRIKSMVVTYHGDTLINQITLMYGGPNALSKNSSQQFSILEKYQKCSILFVFFEINEENLIKNKNN